MSDPVLAKLSAADAHLAAQATELAAQLKALQAKRASLQSVLEIFDADKTTMAAASEMKAATSPPEIAVMAIDSAIATPPKVSLSRQPTQNKVKPPRAGKAASSAKSSRRGWRGYLRDEYLQTPLSAVVAEILQGHPKKVFEIAEVVDSIFVETIPKAARKGARERVSNILAEGARKNQWRRGEAGRYSL